MIKITGIKQDIEDSTPIADLVMSKLGLRDVDKLGIEKESIDARKGKISFVYNVLLELRQREEQRLVDKGLASRWVEENITFDCTNRNPLTKRPIIIGSGPSGMFAALMLAERGFEPIVIERGDDVDQRVLKVSSLISQGNLDPDSNIQFGEGGAGTFSDGKLTSRAKRDRYYDYFIKSMISAGAPSEIYYKSKPHVGTDNLRSIVKCLRQKSISLGANYRFNEKLVDIVIQKGKLSKVITSKGIYDTDTLILAIGHSARDTIEMLDQKGIEITSKPYALGFRIEHPRHLIDAIQYGKYAGHKRLGAAEYHLTYQDEASKRGVYSFCMCPGGIVVPSTSEEGMVVTNGMSEYKRNHPNSNAAFVVTVDERDYGTGRLDGMNYQRKLERLAYNAGGKNYGAPIESLESFVNNVSFSPTVYPTYRPSVLEYPLKSIIGDELHKVMARGIMSFEQRMKGYFQKGAVLTAIETRTSSPIRITRNESYMSNIEGIYPLGEGAGYAGGIVSASVDGIRFAEHLVRNYEPKYS